MANEDNDKWRMQFFILDAFYDVLQVLASEWKRERENNVKSALFADLIIEVG